KDIKDMDITAPFPRITYDDAMAKYGVDKPDTRFGLHLQDITEFSKSADFKVFKSTAESGGLVNAIVVPDQADAYSRKDIDKLENFVNSRGSNGVAWMRSIDEGIAGRIVNHLDGGKRDLLTQLTNSNDDV